MKAPKPIFRATETDGRSGRIVAGDGSVKRSLATPRATYGQRKAAIAIPEHLFEAPDRRCANDIGFRRRVLAVLFGDLVKLTTQGRRFRSRVLSARRG